MKKISNKLKVILFLLVATVMTLVGLNLPTKAADESGKITVTKSATKSMTTSDLEKYTYLTEENLQKGRYAKVNLNVSAKGYTVENETISKLDIVLVFDSSSSMSKTLTIEDENGNEVTTTRMAAAKAAATDFAETLMDDSGNVEIAIVEFGSSTGNVLDFTSNSTEVTNFISTNLSAMTGDNGGTNIHAGLVHADSILDGGREDAKKVIIILTDGVPTFYNYVSGNTTYICGDGQQDEATSNGNYFGNNRTCPDDIAPSDAAKTKLDSMKSEYTTADVYTIAFADANAATSLSKINPESTEDTTPLYRNYAALSGTELKEKFAEIVENVTDIVGTDTVLTDVIPAEFKLPASEVTRLEALGIEVKENGDGTTTLVYDIGNLEAEKVYNLEFIVEAKPAYYGSIYTNESAKLETTIVANNPYYCANATVANPCDTSLELKVANPKVEIPVISATDNYGNVGYAEENILITTSILKNDSIKQNIDEKYNVISHRIVIVEDENVSRIGSTNQYEIKGKGTITINEDGTFSFVSLEGVSGDIEFDYYVATYTEDYEGKETTVTYSNTSTVTFAIQERELIEIQGTKTWVDNNNQDGKRPESIRIHLYQNGEYVTSKVVTENSNWSYTFTNLYKYEIGAEGTTEFIYTITEDAVAEYETTIDGYNVTNKHEIEKITVSGTKTWDDNDDQDGKRPESITINLLANGQEVKEVVVTEEDNWSYTFANLDKYANGEIINYTITEDEVSSYETTIDGYNVTNTHEIEKIEISGTKTWDDNNDQDGKRPESITINLLANGQEVKEVVVTEEDEWSYTFANLDKYANGEIINYTITEDEVAGYTTIIDGYNVTNTHEIEKIEISGTKTWDDNNDQDGKRPESITINLLANGQEVKEVVVTEEDEWSYTFEDLDKYESGQEIVYTITEDEVAEYETTIEGYNVTNKHEIEKIEISGTKTWDDNNDQDGKRPNSIIIRLYADGKELANLPVVSIVNWTYTFENLPKYRDGGIEIVYTITEDEVAEYETTIEGYNVTNTHEIEKIEISGTKTWDDNNDQDGKRPESITINLLADGKVVSSKEVTESDNWSYTFTDLDKYESGQEIVYTITEDEVAEYETTIEGYNVTNTHEIEKIEISGTKTWDDNNDQDGKRPESITINLLANGQEVKEVVVTESDNWSYTFTDLDKYESGQEIVYTITEDEVAEYETTINGYNVTNKHEIEKIEISGTKTWDDNNDQDGKRPETITIHLYKNGEYFKTSVISADEKWSYTFANLDKYESGQEIVYTITEDEVAEYETTIDGYNVTNKHEIEKIEISGTKTWDDNDDQDGKRPESITINLLANGQEVKEVVVTAEDNWSYTFTDLDKYESGQEIVYTITEDEVAEYETTIDGYNVTNKHEIEKIEISGTKTWDDNNDQDGKRPESITINLLANGQEVKEVVVTESDNWSYTFTDLDKYESGQEIVYTITEDEVAEYETTIEGYNVTNKHEIEKIEISGTKTWDDNDDQDGKRPESITINLLANGKEVKEVVVTEEDEWSYTFANLDKYANGEIINYTITEDEVAGYTTTIDGYNVTNKHEIEKIEISGTKTWDDNNDQDGKRPTSIIINLLADGKVINSLPVTNATDWRYTFSDLPKYESGQEIVYTITEDEVAEYETTIDGYNVTNKHEIEKIIVSGIKTWDDNNDQDGKRPETITIHLYKNGEYFKTSVISADEKWSYTFEDLDKYESGQEIVYTITEDEVSEYETTIDGYNVINKHEIEKIEISGTKTWDDNDDQDGKRPETITINLLANGKEVKEVVVTAEDNWKYKFTDLDKYESGQEIVYTITEDLVDEYTTVVNGYDVTNKYTPETITIAGAKTWDDNNNQDGIRPESITVNLLADGKEIQEVVITAENNWSYEFANLDRYKNGGTKIVYTITEDEVSGYTTEINGYNIKNTHEVEKITVSGSKTWNDNNNQDGKRPESITINLLADGKEIQEVTVTDSDNWSYEFTDLDKYKDGGIEIVYTISEDEVAEYTTIIDGYNVTNTHEIEKITVSGTKTWDDNNDQDGIRPESITINLLANGEVVLSKEVTAEDNWTYEFTNLDKYAKGEEINYTITENVIEGYETEIDGYNVTNTHEVEKITVSGTKTWDDNNNQDGIRPESITINLLANGELVLSKEVTAEDNWTYEFTNLDKNKDGKEIVYTITEDEVAGYTTIIDGYNVTNTHIPSTIVINGTKTWADNNNQDGIRPDSIIVRLYADGKEVVALPVTQTTSWGYTFTNLPKYRDGGIEIEYTISEDEVAGYITTINGFNISNVHEAEVVDIIGSKTWDDNNNQDGIRPESIRVRLYADGKEVSDKVVTVDTDWTYTFEDMPKFNNGVEIKYTVSEDEVAGYTTTIEGYNITNTHEVELTEVNGTKIWDDNNNQDGKRPTEITVNLLSDGKVYATQTVTVDDNWKYTFENLPKYRDGGIEVKYTVEEESVAGYISTVNGYDITNSYTPETITIKGSKIWNDKNNQDGKRPMNISINLYANGEATGKVVTIDAEDNWKYEFTNLPKYADGKEIVYTITEDEVAGYTTTIEGFNITNSYTPEKTEVKVTKTWDDNNDQDGKRPESITINLLANNKEIKSVEITESDNWTYTFTNLDKYENGEIISYTITEEAVEEYKTIVDGYNITNTHTPITLNINGEKQWLDNNDEAGFRPESITISLLADGTVIDTKVVTEEDNWQYTFENLPMYKEGQKIKYTVEEEAVENYETSYDEENPFIVVNTHNPSKITVSGTKTWDDNNDQDGIRPETIVVNLTGRVGEEIVYEDTKVVSASDNWKYEFTNLPEYKYGKLIVYTIDEDDVKGYSKEINGYDITNIHTPEIITINGSKAWDDNDNQDGIRPESITVNLLADEKVVNTKEVTAEDNWTYEFTNLPKYRDGGIEINYTITEEAVDGYESEITDFEITNVHTPETVSYSVSKVWSDYENNDGIRPESITVRLIADDVEIASQVISEENNWSYSFVDLPKYRDEGTLIVYEIVEDEVLGYTTTIESAVDVNNPNNTIVIVTNSHEKEQNIITINKIWEDYNNKYGKRPESITIHLYADGELVETITITEETDWTAILSKDKYKNGVEIYYTIDEEEVAEYLTTIDGHTVTNKYIVPPHTGIEVDDNQTLYGTVVALIFSLLGSLFLLKNKLSK